MPASRPVRAAWIIAGSVFAVITLGFGTAQAIAALAHEERDVHTVVDGPIGFVDVQAAGSVTVIGTSERAIVTIDERVSDGLQRPDRSIRVVDGELVVRGTCGAFLATFCGDDIVLRVPRSVRLHVRAEGIAVTGTSGDADLVSYGGGIRVRGATGAMRLRSHGDAVTGTGLGAESVDAVSYGGGVSLSFSRSPERVDASSHGSNISVVLPDRPAAYRVDATSDGGSTETLVRTDPTSPRSIHAESFGGGVTIRYADR